MSFLNFDLNRIIFTLPGVLVAITLHEFAHAYAAYKIGDSTAEHYGRLTLNPLAHIDIAGFLMLLIAGFGWAKPVPINPNNFSSRKLGTFLVSIAGVTMNILLAILFTVLLAMQYRYGSSTMVTSIIINAVRINVGFAIFNMLPIPPLDGSKVILAFLPTQAEYYYYKFQKYSYAILFALLFFNIIDIVLYPAMNAVLKLLTLLLQVLV